MPKPQGKSGAMQIGGGGVAWNVIPFPEGKAEREAFIASMFVGAFTSYVAMESEPSFAPFGEPIQNDENDLDFTIQTSQGSKLLELAEFAPLEEHGPTFAGAPKSLAPSVKADLAYGLIQDKSAHQGGENRLLLIYNTEQGFWLDPFSIEILRRRFALTPPKFDRVYFLSPHDASSGSASEIYPGRPHHIWGDKTDNELANVNFYMPHPTEMTIGRTVSGTSTAMCKGKRISFPFTLNYELGTVGNPWP